MRLITFLKETLNDQAYVSFEHFRIYVIKHRDTRTLEICRMRNLKRPANYMKMEREHNRTGKLKDFLNYIETAAVYAGYDRIQITAIVNEFLPEALMRYGYSFERFDAAYKGEETLFSMPTYKKDLKRKVIQKDLETELTSKFIDQGKYPNGRERFKSFV